jgi:hypothetical protein
VCNCFTVHIPGDDDTDLPGQEEFRQLVGTVLTEENLHSACPTVDVPGHGPQYKSTLVQLLYDDPHLSLDRLVLYENTHFHYYGRCLNNSYALIISTPLNLSNFN